MSLSPGTRLPTRIDIVLNWGEAGKNAYIPPYAQPFNMTLHMTFTMETAGQ